MLVPLMSRTPPPGAADGMSTPGATRVAPALEKSATVRAPESARPTAPTATKPSDAAGGAAAIVYGRSASRRLSLPVAATTSAGRRDGPPVAMSSASFPNCRRLSR